MSGQQWYQLEASRAVNQAIGRIIRHKNDYGAIILCDCRFDNPSFKKHLSAWLRPYVKNFSNFGMITRVLRDFYRYAEHTVSFITSRKEFFNSQFTTFKFSFQLPQPNMVGSASSNRPLLPATTASFDTTAPRKIKNTAKQCSEVTSLVEDAFNIDTYTNENEKYNKSTEVKKKNFFELLATESKPAINFSDCKLKENYTKCELTKNIAEPVTKKRKIKMLPVEFNECLSGPSTSSGTSTDSKDSSKNFQQISEEVNSDTDKKSLGKTYLKEVITQNAIKCTKY